MLTCHTNQEKESLRILLRNHFLGDYLEAFLDNYIYFEGFIYSFEKVDDEILPSANIS